MATPETAYPLQNAKLDYALSILAFFMMCGLMLDGWSHYHNVQETFFTPYHFLFYSTNFLTCIIIAATALQNRRRGYPWNRTLPRGYELSLVGVIWFISAVPLDLLWHAMIGTEKDLGVLLGPAHLYMAISFSLILLGPLRAALWTRPRSGLIAQLPAVLSAAAFLGLMEFFTQYAFAFDAGFTKAMAPVGYQSTSHTSDFALVSTAYYRHVLGLFAVYFHAILIMSVVLFLARSFQMAFGTFTVLLVLSTIPVAAMLTNDSAIFAANVAVAVLTGLLADALYAYLRPLGPRLAQFRWFATVVPAAHYAIFFGVAIAFLGGVWWDVDLILGSVFIASAFGYLLSFLIAPPRYGPTPNWQT